MLVKNGTGAGSKKGKNVDYATLMLAKSNTGADSTNGEDECMIVPIIKKEIDPAVVISDVGSSTERNDRIRGLEPQAWEVRK